MVPEIGEIWDDNSGAHPEKNLELLIKNKVYCELQEAVSSIESEPGFSYVDAKGKTHPVKWIPESWGAQMTLQLTVDESTQLNPGVTLSDPWSPVKSFGAPFAQSFKTAIGGTFSTDANRQDKFTFYYLVPDLEGYQAACENLPKEGSSLLLESNLGIKKWLKTAMDIRSSVGTSERAQQEAVTYDVKFEIVTSAGATPTWTLLRFTGSNGTSSLFGVKRDRTHELILTLGPTQSTPGAKSQPGQLASNEALAQQIGAAVSNAISKSGVILPIAPQ